MAKMRRAQLLKIKERDNFQNKILQNEEVDFRKCLLCLAGKRERNEHHETRDER